MNSAITSLHVIAALILVISVLLQAGKGSGLGAAFGGSSSSVFGSRGPATLISRVTCVAAVIFMGTSLTLSLFAQGGFGTSSVVTDEEPVVIEKSEPVSSTGDIPPVSDSEMADHSMNHSELPVPSDSVQAVENAAENGATPAPSAGDSTDSKTK